MSYSANQYNYATPLSSAAGFNVESPAVVDAKYFTLADNTLDGSYVPISGDAGLWGTSVSDENGELAEPFVVTVTENLYVNAFRILSSAYCYPVAFTIDFKNGTEVIHTITETDNTEADYIFYMPSTLTVTEYTITVTKISKASDVVRLFNVYNPGYVKRTDTLRAVTSLKTCVGSLHNLSSSDTVKCFATEKQSAVTNIIGEATDSLVVKGADVSKPRNVHTIMKEHFRQVYGKVYVTYTDPMLDNETTVDVSNEAYNSVREQLLDNVSESEHLYFNLYDNDLSGRYVVSDENSQVGWTSKVTSDSDGFFAEPPSVKVSFAARPVSVFEMSFDDSHGNLVRDFTVIFTMSDGSEKKYEFVDNDKTVVSIVDSSEGIAEAVSIELTVYRVQRPYGPAVILGMPVSSTFLYRGYSDVSEIISVDLLEELTYEDNIEALGGVSANEVTVVLDNSKREFFFNSNSLVSRQLKRNRKIVPWLGVEVIPNEIEWYTLGTFWSYKWDVPVNSLTATVVGFDTIGLLDTTSYFNHQTQINKSLGALIEYVLEDAKTSLAFIEYIIDESLYEVVIPYAWFEHGSHTAALRKLSLCYPVHIYCNRLGQICAMPQKLHLDYYYDIWADDTNVIDKNYSSLYTALPNIVNVQVISPLIVADEQLVQSTGEFTVYGNDTVTLNFSSPYVSDLRVVIECDDTIDYSFAAYSWGIIIDFTGSGVVRTITCTGSCVDTSTTTTVSKRNAESVRLDGAITRDVSSDFIQTTALANLLIERLFMLSENDKYDATVNYRGDIALSINDPILLKDGIAPDNRYNIKRHELAWNGYLTGSADLNT